MSGFFDKMKNSKEDIVVGSDMAMFNKPVTVGEIISRVSALEKKVEMLKLVSDSENGTWDDNVAYLTAKDELLRYLSRPYYPA